MTTGSGETIEEKSWGFEREEPKAEAIAISAADTLLARVKELFKEDGRIMRIMHAAEKLLGNSMANEGPKDYADDEDLRTLIKAFVRLAERPPVYNNGDDSSGLKKWIASVGVILSASAIIAGWTLSNQVAAQSVKIDNLTDQLRNQNERITRIESNERR